MIDLAGLTPLAATDPCGTHRNCRVALEYSSKPLLIPHILLLCCDASLVEDVSQKYYQVGLHMIQSSSECTLQEAGIIDRDVNWGVRDGCRSHLLVGIENGQAIVEMLIVSFTN